MVASCALLTGCLSGNPSYFPYLLPGGSAERTHPKPMGPGYFADFDPNAKRLEVRPEITTIPVRGAQVLIATIYDRDGKPRRKRRVEWMIEGPGTIIEVDESGYLPGRGMKIDNKYAYSHTDYFEHTITRGNDDPNDDFVIGPGQTWCVISSAVEGQTNVIVYAPEIADWERNKVYVKLNWVDGNLQFPAPAITRAGSEFTFSTKVSRNSERPEGFKVRYRILDGPPAALAAKGGDVDSVTEATAITDENGVAKVKIAQPSAASGTNRIAIDVLRSDPDSPDKLKLVSHGETKITWQAPQLGLNINAPKAVSLQQEIPVTYAVASNGTVGTEALTLSATVPKGLELLRTEPRAVQDGDTLIWSLDALGAGKQHTVQAIYKPTRLGSHNATAEARSTDGLRSSGSATVNVTEAKLLLRLEGPKSATVGEAVTFEATITNTGDGPAEQVKVQARYDNGLEKTDKAKTDDETIGYLPAGQSKTVNIVLQGKQTGKFSVRVGAAGNGDLIALPQATQIEIQDAQLTVTAYGPERAYVGQDVEWKIAVKNGGDVGLSNTIVRANLPAEVTFLQASDEGKLVAGQVVWEIGNLNSRQEKIITLTGNCTRLATQSALQATATSNPATSGSASTVGRTKAINTEKPAKASLQIIGVAALQISVKDTDDPIGVGQRTSYTVKVKNSGTAPANKVLVAADVPVQMRPLRGSGSAGAGKIDTQRVTFPVIESLPGGTEATYVIEVEALTPGEARFRVEVANSTTKQPLRAEEPTRILGRESRPSP